MTFSIQQEIIKINRRLSEADVVSLAITSFIILVFALFLVNRAETQATKVAYEEGNTAETFQNIDTRPFASKNGPTYTYSWCQGSDKIKQENIIYFSSAEAAEQSGRMLSKLCQR